MPFSLLGLNDKFIVFADESLNPDIICLNGRRKEN